MSLVNNSTEPLPPSGDRKFPRIKKPLCKLIEISSIGTAIAGLALASCTTTESSPLPDNTIPACVSPKITPKTINIDVCFMRWSSSYELTPELQKEFNELFNRTTQLYKEMTYGETLLNINLRYPGTIWNGPQPKAWDDEVNFAAQECGSLIDFDDISAFAVFPGTFLSPTRSWGENTIVSTPQGDKRIGVIRLGGFEITSEKLFVSINTLPHEIGHAINNYNHATRYICKAGSTETSYSLDPANCFIQTYGNIYDLMGGGFHDKNNKHIYGSTGSFEKSLSALIPVKKIEDDGEYPLAANEIPCSNVPQLLTVRYKDVPLCVEYRKPIGPDNIFSYDNVQATMGIEAGIPDKGCLMVSICSNDSTTFNFAPGLSYGGNLINSGKGSNFLINPTPNIPSGPNDLDLDQFAGCIEPSGFTNSELGIAITYVQSISNPDAVMVHITKIDKQRLANKPNLKIALDPTTGFEVMPGIHAHVENISQNSEFISPFSIVTSGKRKTDGQYEQIDSQTVNDGLALFSTVAIDFSPPDLTALAMGYTYIKIDVDKKNSISETDENDNSVTFPLP